MDINSMVIFIGGVLVGIVAMLIWLRFNTIGTLRIDHINFEKDLYRFDITKDLSTLDHKNVVVLKVDAYADLSQQ